MKGVNFGAHARQERLEILESLTVKFVVSMYANWSIGCMDDVRGGGKTASVSFNMDARLGFLPDEWVNDWVSSLL